MNLDDELGVEPVTPAKLDRPGQEVKALIVPRVTEESHANRALHCWLRSRSVKRDRQNARLDAKVLAIHCPHGFVVYGKEERAADQRRRQLEGGAVEFFPMRRKPPWQKAWRKHQIADDAGSPVARHRAQKANQPQNLVLRKRQHDYEIVLLPNARRQRFEISLEGFVERLPCLAFREERGA